jgi:hypothetical protein
MTDICCFQPADPAIHDRCIAEPFGGDFIFVGR